VLVFGGFWLIQWWFVMGLHGLVLGTEVEIKSKALKSLNLSAFDLKEK